MPGLNNAALVPQRESYASDPVEKTEVEKRYLPVMSLAVAKERREMIIAAIQDLMVEATPANNFEGDYGVLPGTKQKSLLQPGADKLNNLFGLVPRFETVSKELDWTGEEHGGEPFFFYEVKASLWRDGTFLMGEGIGSANSWESKYRYRKAERVCPNCGVAAIIKGKAEFGGGWLCFKKKDGCGATFPADDPDILQQVTGYISNEQIFDLVNTILKIAAKRAKIGGTINATSAHEFFKPEGTKPNEDLPDDLTGEDLDALTSRQPPPASPRSPRPASSTPPKSSPNNTQLREQVSAIDALWARMKNAGGIASVFSELAERCGRKLGPEQGSAFYVRVLQEFQAEKPEDLRPDSARRCAKELYLRLEREPAYVATDEDLPAGLFGGKV